MKLLMHSVSVGPIFPLQSPIQDYGIPMKNLNNWFEEEEAKHKREDLRLLILGLQKELNPDLDYDPTKDGCLPEQPLQQSALGELMDTSDPSSSQQEEPPPS
jgi:hypothetical protein